MSGKFDPAIFEREVCIIDQLRYSIGDIVKLLHRAEKAEAKLARFEAALREIAGDTSEGYIMHESQAIARNALADEKEGGDDK